MKSNSGNRIKYSTFLEYVQEGYVSEITIINDKRVEGEYTEKAVADSIITPSEDKEERWTLAETSDGNTFKTIMLTGDEIRRIVDRNDVTYDVRIEDDW